MDTTKYEVFLKIVEQGSLTRAAEELGYTQAGVSHSLNALEREWRMVLLRRDRSGIRLTSEGQRLLPLITAVCLANRALDREIADMHDLNAGLVRIGGFTSISSQWLPDILETFRTRCGKIDFELVHGNYREIADWLRDGDIDVGFLRMPAPPEFDQTFLGQDRLVVVLPENHPLAACDRIPPDRLADEPFLLLEEGPDNEILAVLREHLVTPNITFRTSDDHTIMSMVERGLGIAVIPELVLLRMPYRFVVRELEVPAYRKICLAVKDPSSLTPAARRFVDFVHGEGRSAWARVYGPPDGGAVGGTK